MEKPSYFRPKFPPRHKSMEEAMGRFIIVWSVLEDQLSSGMAVILMIDATLVLTITANLGTKAKIDMLHSAVSMSEDILDPTLVDRAHKILDVIADLAGKHRNTLAHGTILQLPSGWRWSRTSARRALDYRVYAGPVARWRKATSKVQAATREWCSVYQEIWRTLDRTPREERDDTYGFSRKHVGLDH